MSNFVDSLIRWWDSRSYRLRTVVPGKVTATDDAASRERNADFQTGIADLVAGEAAPAELTPDAPVMNFSGGGFYVLLPTAVGDEMLGMVSDRAIGEWRLSRSAGEVDRINGKRSKVLHDVMLTPFQITAPLGAPPTWDHLVLGGPAGAAIDVETSGQVTITKAGDPVATITLDTAGSITIAVVDGQTVKLGGAAATLGVARLNDKTVADTAMAVWIGQVQVVTAAAAALLGLPTPVAPSDFGKIAVASTKVLSQ